MTGTQEGDTATGPINSRSSSARSSDNPELVKALQSAHRLFKKNKISQAKTALLELIKENPGETAPHLDLGIIQLSEDDAQSAEASFKDALKIDDQSSSAHNLHGVSLRMQGRFNEAEQAYQTALKHEPAYPLAHRNLGILYDLYLAKPEAALKHYQRYQTLLGTQEKAVENWIVDLQRRIGKSR
jgi:Flp pilus assembly protein TadD